MHEIQRGRLFLTVLISRFCLVFFLVTCIAWGYWYFKARYRLIGMNNWLYVGMWWCITRTRGEQKKSISFSTKTLICLMYFSTNSSDLLPILTPWFFGAIGNKPKNLCFRQACGLHCPGAMQSGSFSGFGHWRTSRHPEVISPFSDLWIVLRMADKMIRSSDQLEVFSRSQTDY